MSGGVKEAAPINNPSLLNMTFNVTREQLAGLDVIQALRAVGPLQELRLTSNRLVAQQFAEVLAEMFGWQVDESLVSQSRVSVDAGYSVVELALEDDTVSTGAILEQGAQVIRMYWRDILQQRA